jgi:hypothetical protein
VARNAKRPFTEIYVWCCFGPIWIVFSPEQMPFKLLNYNGPRVFSKLGSSQTKMAKHLQRAKHSAAESEVTLIHRPHGPYTPTTPHITFRHTDMALGRVNSESELSVTHWTCAYRLSQPWTLNTWRQRNYQQKTQRSFTFTVHTSRTHPLITTHTYNAHLLMSTGWRSTGL